MSLWLAIAGACLGCAALKGLGYVIPSRVFERRAAAVILDALPVAVLSALVAVATFAGGQRLVLDSRAAGLATAIVLVAVRAPFLVVVAAACAVAAAVHAL
jgi:uncharacterized membrane protein